MGQSLAGERELPPVCGPAPGRVVEVSPGAWRVVDAVMRVQGGAGRGRERLTLHSVLQLRGLIGFPVDTGMVWR